MRLPADPDHLLATEAVVATQDGHLFVCIATRTAEGGAVRHWIEAAPIEGGPPAGWTSTKDPS